jgi:hypothetical protein
MRAVERVQRSQVGATDVRVESIDLPNNHVPRVAGIALVVVAYSAVEQQLVFAVLIVLGDVRWQVARRLLPVLIAMPFADTAHDRAVGGTLTSLSALATTKPNRRTFRPAMKLAFVSANLIWSCTP